MALTVGRYNAKKVYENGNLVPPTYNKPDTSVPRKDPYDYYSKVYNETGIEIIKINPDGSAVAKMYTPAGDKELINNTSGASGGAWIDGRDNPWYQLDGGTKQTISFKSFTGDRYNTKGFNWSETFTIPAGTKNIRVGAYLDWWLSYEVRNSSFDLKNNYYRTEPPIWLYGKLEPNKTKVRVSYGNWAISVGLNDNMDTKSLKKELALDLAVHKVDQADYQYISSKTYDNQGAMTDCSGGIVLAEPWKTGEDYTIPSDYNVEEWRGKTFDAWAKCYIWLRNRSWVEITGDVPLDLPVVTLKELEIDNEFPDGSRQPMKKDIINEYNGQATPIWDEVDNQTYVVSNCSFVPDLGVSNKTVTIKNGHTYKDYGTYTFTLTTSISGTNMTQTETRKFRVVDDTPPSKPVIVDDKLPKTIIYDMVPRLYLGPCYPTVEKMEALVDYEAELTFTPFINNCGDLDSSPKYSNRYYKLASELNESGFYVLKVTATKQRNGKTATRKVNWYIDNLPPDPPIITIEGKDYQGVFGEVAKIPTPVVPVITVQKGCTYEQEVYYKKRNKDSWVKINPLNVYDQKGYYKIRAIATKTSNGLKSDWSEVVFQKKIKYTWLITIDPNSKCYRTVATIHFDNDYSLKKMYKIDDGEWQWYLGPVFIYENCTFYAKSLDGDDDYESNISSKVIDVIDTMAPAPVQINITNGDVNSIFVPKIIK